MIIAIANYKGGVGKTTTAINVAYNLAVIYEKKVLMIDADSSRNLSVFYSKYDESKPGLSDVLSGRKTLKQCIRRTKYKNLDIIQAKKELNSVNVNPVEFFVEVRYSEEALCYDYIIIDCHPDFNAVTRAVLISADHIIVPLKVDRNAMNGLELMNEIIQELNESDIRNNCDEISMKSVITMYQNNNVTNREIIRFLNTTIYERYKAVIRYTCRCVESIEKRKPLSRRASKSTAALDYITLTEEILKEMSN